MKNVAQVNREGNGGRCRSWKGVIFDATGEKHTVYRVECPYAIKYLDNKNFSIHKCKLDN
ncbi:MAG: hypothetical protein CM15mP118_1860 [Alphaproteobacteria bacterium]|nr:MAG: hypothetical protein CM15mP118_1860 [Alphaproteobacteria bacterium]